MTRRTLTWYDVYCQRFTGERHVYALLAPDASIALADAKTLVRTFNRHDNLNRDWTFQTRRTEQ